MTAAQPPTPITTSAFRIQAVSNLGAVGKIPSRQGCCVQLNTLDSSRMTQTSTLTFRADSRNLSLTATLPSTRMKLRQGELRLNDNTGDPKFPVFLYNEEAMDGTFTTGLLRGPFLLAVSSDSVTMKANIAHGQHLRCSLPSLFLPLPRLVRRRHQSEGMPESMGWRRLSPRLFVTQRFTCVPTFSESQPTRRHYLSRHTLHCVVAIHGERNGRASGSHASTCFSENSLLTRTTPGASKLSSGGTSTSLKL